MNRFGMWSAYAMFLLGIVYAVTVAIGMGASGLDKPIVDPVLALMEVLTLLSAPILVCVMAAVHATASSDDKVYSSTALAFMVLVAGLTSAVHFVGLTALRQTGSAGITWPSPLYALELLAWDFFLGLSLLSAAPVFRGGGPRRVIRSFVCVTGVLCLVGTLGPATGEMRLQFIAVLGYGLVLPVTCLLLARDFHRSSLRGLRSATERA